MRAAFHALGAGAAQLAKPLRNHLARDFKLLPLLPRLMFGLLLLLSSLFRRFRRAPLGRAAGKKWEKSNRIWFGARRLALERKPTDDRARAQMRYFPK